MRGRWKRSRRLQRHLRPRREVFDAVAEDHREEEGRGKTSTFRTHKEPLIHSAGNFSGGRAVERTCVRLTGTSGVGVRVRVRRLLVPP